MAARIARETPGAYFINQFGNPDNPAAHEHGTGPELLRQLGGKLDAIVFGCGSSGTMTGLSRFLAKASPSTEMRSEEHTSELQSLMRISYAVFCLKKKKH